MLTDRPSEPAVGIEQLAGDPPAMVRTEECDEVGGVFGTSCSAERGSGQGGGPVLIGHPAGIHGPRVYGVGGYAKGRKLVRGRVDQSIDGALGDPIGDVAGRVVAGEGNDASRAHLALVPVGELLDEKKCTPGIDREVAVAKSRAVVARSGRTTQMVWFTMRARAGPSWRCSTT